MPPIRIQFHTFFSRFFFCFFAFVSNGSMFNSTNRQPSIGRFNENVQKMCQPLLFAYSFSDFHLCFVFGMLLMSLYSLLRSVLVTIIRTVIKLLFLSPCVCMYVCLIIWSCWLSQFQIIALAICDIHTHSVYWHKAKQHTAILFSCVFLSALSHHGG